MRRLLPRSPRARAVVAVVALFVALNVVVLLVSTLAPEPGGEIGSAYATQPRGAAAYAELLRGDGHRVSYLREPLDDTRLDPAQTVVVLDAPKLDDGERAALARFVRAGGRLVAGGAHAGAGVVPDPPRWVPTGARVARPSLPVPETRAVRSVASAGQGAFAEPGATLPVLGSASALLVIAESGSGRALLLADASPLQNRLLAHADNAALALALAGPSQRPVAFVESVHGFGAKAGLAALPGRWRVALLVAVLAACCGWGRGRAGSGRRRTAATSRRQRAASTSRRSRARCGARASRRWRSSRCRSRRARRSCGARRWRPRRRTPTSVTRHCGSASRRMRPPR